MRTALVYGVTGLAGGSGLQVREVRSERFRDYWFRSTEAAGVYTLDVYRTKADAEAQASKLGSGTHAAGIATVTIAAAGGAPFDPTPMTVEVTAEGTWTSIVVGWTAEPERYVGDRIEEILNRYRAANEPLEGLLGIDQAAGRPASGWPRASISVGASADAEESRAILGTMRFEVAISVWHHSNDQKTAMQTVLGYAGQLRSIALDEQRRWGGLVQNSRPARPIELAVYEGASQSTFIYEARFVLEVTVSEMVSSLRVGGTEADGGKYVAGL